MIFKGRSEEARDEIINEIIFPAKKILKIIRKYVAGDREEVELLNNIRGNDSIVNVFLKVAALMCKLAITEKGYTKLKDDSKINEIDINIMRDFLKKYDETSH